MFKLRELEEKDLSVINNWRNDPDLIAMLGAPFRYINLTIDKKWYEDYIANRNNVVRCSIIDQNNNNLILGLVSLASIDYLNQSAELHIMIGDNKNQGRGAGSFAIKEMLNHGFNNLNLNRIELTVVDSNKRAQHVYQKIGFVHEGIKRCSKYKNGCFVDMHIYSILKEEFNKNNI